VATQKHKVVVGTRSFGSTSQKPWDVLREGNCQVQEIDIITISDEDLMQALSDAAGFIVGSRPITGRILQAAPDLKIISMHGVGVDHIDLKAAAGLGVMVANCPGANADSVADLTLGLMLTLARRLHLAATAVRSGDWGRFPGVQICDKTLGLLGFGAIGKEVARRGLGFRMRVLVHDPYLDPTDPALQDIELVELDELFKRADFLSLHAPSTPDTQHIINSKTLALMKPDAYLLNMARGELVDEAALLAALTSGIIAGAGLDVFAQEPPNGNPLLELENVVATPHMGAHSKEATTNTSTLAAANVVQTLTKGEPLHRVA
jgi:D-3-phosphoglycerate dehydrogenase